MKNHIKLKLVAVFLILALFIIIWQISKPITIPAHSTAKLGTLSDTISEDGIINSEDEIVYYVPFDAKIKDIVDEGANVKKGDILFVMDDSDLLLQKTQLFSQLSSTSAQKELNSPTQNQIAIAEIALSSAKNTLSDATLNLERMKSLYDGGGISKEEYENVQTAYNEAKRNLEAKQRQLDDLNSKKYAGSNLYGSQTDSLQNQIEDINKKLSKKQVTAEVNGVVKSVNAKKNSFVSSAQPVLELVSTENYNVEFSVMTENATALHKGDKVKIIQEIHDRDIEYTAIITQINDFAHSEISSLGLSEQKVNVKARIEGDAKTIKNGYDVNVEISIFEKPNVLFIPKTAYYQEGDKYYVWKIKNSKIYKSQITLGYIGALEVEVLEGLEENDLLVSDPSNSQLKDGKRIKIEK